jgi:probable rRNA maturation factor
MSSSTIQIHQEHTLFSVDEASLINWLRRCLALLTTKTYKVSYILVSDNELRTINKDHLNHDYFTDIVTFDLSEPEGSVEIEMYLSLDRIKENAQEYGVENTEELRRVMVHGLLHVFGFDDHNEEGQLEMRAEEDKYLSI